MIAPVAPCAASFPTRQNGTQTIKAMNDSHIHQLTQKTECCGQCPFARSTPKTYLDTRGQNGERFAGQAAGPFMLPCHMTAEFPDFREHPEAPPLCAGAAKYRANAGYAGYLPPGLGQLPPDHEAVFSNPAELLAHHEGITVEQAQENLGLNPVHHMTLREIARQSELTHVRIRAGEGAKKLPSDLRRFAKG